MPFSVLVVGAGQIGSRYLQGLSKCSIPLSVFVSDISTEALAVSRARWLEVGGQQTPHRVSMFTGLAGLPDRIDLVIVSTNALVRPGVVRQVNDSSQVGNWLLEKVLAQNEDNIGYLESTVGTQAKAWVNTPYRAMEWYNRIRRHMNLGGKFSCAVRGGNTFGLACNAIHYLDLLAWLSGESVMAITTTELEAKWYPSKRAGFWDVFGKIEAMFSGGSRIIIESSNGAKSPVTIQIQAAEEEWIIHEWDGIAVRNHEFTIEGRDELQSEMTAPVVESILLTGTCLLPRLHESALLHIPMLNAFLDHWNGHMPDKLLASPIT